MTDQRTLQLRDRLHQVHRRIAMAAEAAGRDDQPELIVVTKYFPAEDVARLYSLGLREVGENKDQEAAHKAAAIRDQTPGLNWHFIGQLQSNKAKSVATYARSVQSVDRLKLITALSSAVLRAQQEGVRSTDLDCLIQLDLRASAEDDTRGGATPEDLRELADQLTEAPGLQLRGVMAVAPLGEPAEQAFQKLQQLSGQLREKHPGATWISAGMSQDLESAVAWGATHLRIGRDVLGDRPLHG